MSWNALYNHANTIDRNAMMGGGRTAGNVDIRRATPQNALMLGSMLPVVGDAIGLAGDAYGYMTDPSSRNAINYGLTAASLIPGVPRMKPSKEAVREALEQIKQKHGLSALDGWLSNNGDLYIGMIEVAKDQRKKGIGSAAMQDVSRFADDSGLRVTLTPGLPDDRHGTTSRGRLVDFYKRFGFVENKGRKKDFTISEGMYREPKK